MILSRVLAKKDRAFAELLLAVGKVKLYVYKTKWVDASIEGPMFVYRRHRPPHCRLVVFNTKRLRDFVLDFDQNLDYSIMRQFLMLKKDFVYGIWFYNIDEFCGMAETMHRVVSPSSSTKSGGLTRDFPHSRTQPRDTT